MHKIFLASVLAVPIALAPCAHAQLLYTGTGPIDLGRIVGDSTVDHVVPVRNAGDQPVRIRDVQLTPPLTVTRMKAVVPPGETSGIAIRLGTPRPPGPFQGTVTVNFDGGDPPLELVVSAVIAPAIELRPGADLTVVTDRGTPASDSLEIVSHLEQPIRIEGAEQSTERWSTSLEELEKGRRWRLALHMSGDGPAGKRAGTLALRTDDPRHPTIPVRVRTSLRERVYTFPDRVEFGRLAAGSVDANKAALYETSVMVYQTGGKDFQVKVSTDVPFLVVRPEKSRQFGDRWQIFLSIAPDRLAAGQRGGRLVIETNDDEFPRVEVPVDADVVALPAAQEPARASE